MPCSPCCTDTCTPRAHYRIGFFCERRAPSCILAGSHEALMSVFQGSGAAQYTRSPPYAFRVAVHGSFTVANAVFFLLCRNPARTNEDNGQLVASFAQCIALSLVTIANTFRSGGKSPGFFTKSTHWCSSRPTATATAAAAATAPLAQVTSGRVLLLHDHRPITQRRRRPPRACLRFRRFRSCCSSCSYSADGTSSSVCSPCCCCCCCCCRCCCSSCCFCCCSCCWCCCCWWCWCWCWCRCSSSSCLVL
jgi:hypothetical protein